MFMLYTYYKKIKSYVLRKTLGYTCIFGIPNCFNDFFFLDSFQACRIFLEFILEYFVNERCGF